MLRKFKFSEDLTKIRDTVHKDLLTFRKRNASEKGCTENQYTRFMVLSNLFFENHTAYEIQWKNMIQPDRSQVTI